MKLHGAEGPEAPAARLAAELGATLTAARCPVVIGSRRDAITVFPVVTALQEDTGTDPFGDGRASERIVQGGLQHVLFDAPAPTPFGRDRAWSLPGQRQPDHSPRAGDPVTHADAELTAPAHRHGSPQPVRRGQQDR